jgi:hypothetical protein
MGFEEAMDAIARGVEVIGILTLVLGLAAALVRAGLVLVGGRGAEDGYRISLEVEIDGRWPWRRRAVAVQSGSPTTPSHTREPEGS